MIIDEGFSYCDNEAVGRLTRLFEYLRGIYEYVIVITHNEQIQKYTDTTIEITKEGKFSKITNINTSANKQELIKSINILSNLQ